MLEEGQRLRGLPLLVPEAPPSQTPSCRTLPMQVALVGHKPALPGLEWTLVCPVLVSWWGERPAVW